MSLVILVDSKVKSQHFLSVCPSTIKSQSRIIQWSPAIQQRMPFVRECPCLIFSPGSPQQKVIQGDHAFVWITQQASRMASSVSSSSSSSSSSTIPSDSVQGYDVTMTGNMFGFISDSGTETFMDDHGMSRCSAFDGKSSGSGAGGASGASGAGGAGGLSSGRVSKNDDIMEKFEAMKQNYQAMQPR
jgi:hypothetical protein